MHLDDLFVARHKDLPTSVDRAGQTKPIVSGDQAPLSLVGKNWSSIGGAFACDANCAATLGDCEVKVEAERLAGTIEVAGTWARAGKSGLAAKAEAETGTGEAPTLRVTAA